MPATQRAARAVQDVGRILGLGLLARRGVLDVGGVLGPVVVVAEDLGLQPCRAQPRSECVDHCDLLAHWHVHAGIAAGVAVLRLVLHGDRVDRHSGALIGLEELHEIAGVGGIDRGVVDEPAADERLVGLHPGRRTPWRGDDLEVGVVRQGGSQQRQDLRAVVPDAEVLQRVVGLTGRHVVVGVVVALDEVRGAHRLPEDGQAVAVGGAEQVAHRRGAGRGVEPVEHLRGRVGDRGAEPDHALVGAGRVDGDRQSRRAATMEGDVALVAELLGAVRSGDPHPGLRPVALR